MEYQLHSTPYATVRLWLYCNPQTIDNGIYNTLKIISLWNGADKINADSISFEYATVLYDTIKMIMARSDIKERTNARV